jgi:aryl-alcohol dehydrogenase-like predicted oxidoreductase
MKYGKILNVDLPVSRILMGTASEPFQSGGDASEILDAMFELGITAIDTARNYGLAEKSVGDWMEKRGNRDRVVILSKCAHPDEFSSRRISEKDIREDFAVSTALLKTDYIDIYLLHRDVRDVDVSVPVEVLNALHSEGKIRAFGVSNWTLDRIMEANEYAAAHGLIPFSVSSPNYSLAYQAEDMWGGSVTISGPENKAVRDWYAETRMPVVAHSPMARGFFSGRFTSGDREAAAASLDEFARKGFYFEENFERLRRCEIMASRKGCTVAQLSVAWLFSSPMDMFAAISTSSPQRMAQNIAALDIDLTPAERDYLDLVTDSID